MNELEELRNKIENELKVDIQTKNRNKDIVKGRKLFCAIAKTIFYPKITLSEIARFIDIHHATVIHHYEDLMSLSEYDIAIRRQWYAITETMKGLPPFKGKHTEELKLVAKDRIGLELVIANSGLI